MSISKKIIAIILILTIASASVMLLPADDSYAASKKTIYVVSSVKIKNGSKTIKPKISYTKGLIKKITLPGEKMTFSYNKKKQLKKYVDNKTTGEFKGKEVVTYTWKNNLMQKRTSKVPGRYDISVSTYKYKKKQLTAGKTVSKWVEDGKNYKYVGKETYKCKKGMPVYVGQTSNSNKEKFSTANTFKYDKKKNITRRIMTMNGKKFSNSYYKAKITYKNGRVSKMKTEHLIPMGMNEKPAKCTITVSYKKIKVKKAYAGTIEKQQWQLINNMAGFSTGSTNAPNLAW